MNASPGCACLYQFTCDFCVTCDICCAFLVTSGRRRDNNCDMQLVPTVIINTCQIYTCVVDHKYVYLI